MILGLRKLAAMDTDVHDENQQLVWGNPSRGSVYCWIADYVFQEAWEEFSTVFTVDSDTNKHFISGLTQKIGMNCQNEKIITKFRLLHFMVLLCDAKSALIEDGNGITYLEQAYSLLQQDIDLDDKEALAEKLRLQAVLLCCRREEWDLANVVFERLWKCDDSSPTQKMLKTILDEKKQENVLQNCPAYETFLQTARESISGTMKKVETPLLEKVYLQMKAWECDSHGCDEEDFSTPLQSPHTISANLSQEKGSKEHIPVEEVNSNHNNAPETELFNALELTPRMTRRRQKLAVDGASGKVDQRDSDASQEFSISVVEVPKKELRSRTVPAYVKQQTVIKSPKKMRILDEEKGRDGGSLHKEIFQEELVIDERGKMDDANILTSSYVDGGVREAGTSSHSQQNGQGGGVGGGEGSKEETYRLRENGEHHEDDLAEELIDPPVTGIILRNTFSKMGHGPQFWDSVDKDLFHLHKSLANETSNHAEEPESDEDVLAAPSASSTPNKKSPAKLKSSTAPSQSPSNQRRQRMRELSSEEEEEEEVKDPSATSAAPTTGPYKVSLTFTKPLPASSRLPFRKIRAVTKDPLHHNGYNGSDSRGKDQPGPSIVGNDHSHENDLKRKKRRHRLRDIEKSLEEDGEKVMWTSSSSESDCSVDSMISKASLKSPKLRKSLELSSVRTRRPWTKDEIKMLIKGVKQFGVGHWADIVTHYSIDRTNVNLKDKWRDLVKRYQTSSPSKMEDD
ncbi:uncharacterized protein [Apostichopus japonicus]|uniref:uncharacterized protein n=1 Tax=Stichopus japonicus TaxID=307972 RepID=UPI003AB2F80C